MLSPAMSLLKDYTCLECKGEGGVSSISSPASTATSTQGQVSPSHAALPGGIKPILRCPLLVLERGCGLTNCQG